MSSEAEQFELLLCIAAAAESIVDGEKATTIFAVNPAAQAMLDDLRRCVRRWQGALLEGRNDDVRVHTQPCDRCRCPIFFAKTINDRWMPMEIETVEAASMLPAWRWSVVFDRMAGDIGAPHVLARPMKTEGEVWVCHIDTCGAGTGPRHRIPSLIRRWKSNVNRANGEDVETRAALQALSARLSETVVTNADN